ncbi:MAG TPA: deoxyribodipyrimidine photo-lyase [Candidatus Sulfotelmatobacter sp.]|jgi:deoxyribodipyrimidine photo-lyase|nr:deoxyribodipyrimidine photo-lyase [Candidatus Sulfotelmatobacter sp.]
MNGGSAPSSTPVILWFRRDLRLADNPALNEAVRSRAPILPVFILEDDLPRPPGGASRWWLHHSLAALAGALAAKGAPPLLLKGSAARLLPQLAARIGAGRILANRRNDPKEAALDARVAQALDGRLDLMADDLLFEPGSVLTQAGQPVQVFTPFWRNALKLPAPPRPLPAPGGLNGFTGLNGDALADWRLLPAKPDWSAGLAGAWNPGEAAAHRRLGDFLDHDLDGYARLRDVPSRPGTSRMSPYLAFGEISPRQIWHVARAAGAHPAEGFLRELGWREFCHHMLIRHPDMARKPQRPEFERFPWSGTDGQWTAFTKGQTGYPIVDAGLRELWTTGWMHNRVRMIVASFLVKDLLIPWQKGETWFWDTLVDADAGNNAGGWQWVTGCGMDSAPYFRIFNPVLQGQKFDPDGVYVRRWCPELAKLPDRFLHAPWTASPLELAAAGVRLGATYPDPLVNHDAARKKALAALERLKG